MNKVILITLPVFSIFLSIALAIIFYYLEKKQGNKLIITNGWIWLLVIQGIYLSLDVINIITSKDLFGLLSASFMIGLGIFLVFISIINNYFEKHGFFQGLFYLIFGVLFLVYRYKNYYKIIK